MSAVAETPSTPASSGVGIPRSALVALGIVLLIIGASVSEFIGESLVIGATENAPLVLAALGFALIYRLTGLLNVAFAETVTLGGYFGIWFTGTFGVGFAASVLPVGIMAGLLSVATYLIVFRPAQKRRVEGLELIVISFGLSLFLRHALQFVFGFNAEAFDTPPPNTIQVFGVGVPSFRLFAVATVAVLAFAIYQFIRRTNYGLQIRALASNRGLAEASGIHPLRVTLLIWFVAGLAGGLAGAFFGVASSVSSGLGARQLLLILLIVLVGGIWDLVGVVWVGAATGIVLTALTLQFNDLWAQIILIVFFLVVLRFRGRRLNERSKV